MTIEQTRIEAVSRLAELNRIQPMRYSAMDLHSKRPLLSRVQRQEDRRFIEKVKLQKKKLTKDISDIDKYLLSLKEVDEKSLLFQPIPMLNITFKQKPVLKRTRLAIHTRGGRY